MVEAAGGAMSDADSIARAYTICAGCMNGATSHLRHEDRLEVFRRLIGPNRPTDGMAIRLYMVAADSYIAHYATYRAADPRVAESLKQRLQELAREYEATRATVLELLKS
jgi:hypothetical protein